MPSYPAKQWELWARVLFLLALAVTACFVQLVTRGLEAQGGSYTGYLLVAPLLGALMAGGVTQPPRGVADAESDWIVAILIGGSGFLAIRLLSHRLPTLAGLWRVENFRMVFWVAACGMVIFSVRHVLRLWSVWLFAFFCAPVMPYLLFTAELGGTEDAAVLVATALGSVAVYFATWVASRPWRLLTAGLNFAFAYGVDRLLDLDSVLLRVIIVAGVIPVLSNTILHQSSHLAGVHRFANVGTRFPHRRAWAYPTLIVVALIQLWIYLPLPTTSAIPEARPDWTAKMGVRPSAEFPFIARFAGPGATLTRYQLPAEPAVAIDVITTPNLPRLNDYRDAIWYPSPAPLNYTPAQLSGPIAVDARSLHSNADRTATGQAQDWYLLTWTWRTAAAYQRVTVIVNQALSPDPPSPRPLTWGNSLIEPMLWLARQQPDSAGLVSPDVSDTADSVARQILIAGVLK